MLEPQISKNETDRLKSLHALKLLDTPIEERFERFTRMVQMALGVPISAFTLVDKDRQWFKSIQGADATETSRSLSFCAHAILEADEILHVPDATRDERFHDNPLVTGNPNIGLYAGCPIRSPDGHAIGSLCAVDSQSRVLNTDQLQTLRDLGAMLENELRAAALSRSHGELIEQLDAAERLALIDPLTRVWNRRGIEEILKREWTKASRHNECMSVIMADIDHFKRINDAHGHPVGDEVIRATSRKLLSALRTEDAVGRFGGEEFMIVLSNHKPEMLQPILERLRTAIAGGPFATEAGEIPVTVSLGAAMMEPAFPISTEALIKRADDALYESKQNGRNRTSIAA